MAEMNCIQFVCIYLYLCVETLTPTVKNNNMFGPLHGEYHTWGDWWLWILEGCRCDGKWK